MALTFESIFLAVSFDIHRSSLVTMTKKDQQNQDIIVEVQSIAPTERSSQGKNDMEHFTATGRPYVSCILHSSSTPKDDEDLLITNSGSRIQVPSEASGLAAMQYDNFTPTAPQLLPWKFTDDDLISIPVPWEPSDDDDDAAEPASKAKGKSWGSKIRDKLGKNSSPQFRIVQVSRGDYLRYFAKDEQGRYCGTEPEGLGLRLLRERERQPKPEGHDTKEVHRRSLLDSCLSGLSAI